MQISNIPGASTCTVNKQTNVSRNILAIYFRLRFPKKIWFTGDRYTYYVLKSFQSVFTLYVSNKKGIGYAKIPQIRLPKSLVIMK